MKKKKKKTSNTYHYNTYNANATQEKERKCSILYKYLEAPFRYEVIIVSCNNCVLQA